LILRAIAAKVGRAAVDEAYLDLFVVAFNDVHATVVLADAKDVLDGHAEQVGEQQAIDAGMADDRDTAVAAVEHRIPDGEDTAPDVRKTFSTWDAVMLKIGAA
jgi:hypothetical protein